MQGMRQVIFGSMPAMSGVKKQPQQALRKDLFHVVPQLTTGNPLLPC